MIQWLMNSATGIEAETETLIARMLLINFAALHTTTIVPHVAFTPDI
jgi:hypothetical protein